MELSSYDIELIESCFFDNASAEQLNELTKLRKDPAFEEAYILHIRTLEAVKQGGRADLKRHLQEIEASLEPSKTISLSTYAKPLLGLAAVLVFAVSIFWVMQPDTSSQPLALYESYYKTYPNTIAPAKRGTVAEDDLSKAFFAYDEANYTEAIALLKELKEDQPRIDVYIGICHLELGQNNDAIAVFTEVKNRQDSQSDAAIWYLSLAHLKNGELKESIKILELIGVESFYHERAKRLRKQLKE